MRVVIFHDFLIERGGGERVIGEIANLPFKKKIVVSTFFIPEKTYPLFKDIKIISLDKLLSNILTRSKFLKVLIAILFFKYFLRKFSKYFDENFDIAIFSGFYSIYFAPYLKIKKICYIQSEPLFMVFSRISYKSVFNLLRPFLSKLFNLEKKSYSNIDLIIANSEYTRSLFFQYGINIQEVIYPPVNTKKFKCSNSKDYFLFVGRLYKHKRVDTIARVFNKISGEKLKIVGSGPLSRYIKKVAGNSKNIEYLGSVDDKTLIDLYSKCKAVIYITEKEPFGIVPVEANASGKPAIVSNEGGLTEAILPMKTGIAINEPYDKNLEIIIKNFDKFKFSSKECRKYSSKFDRTNFRKKIIKVLRSQLIKKNLN